MPLLERERFPGYREPEPNGVLLALQRVLDMPNWLLALLLLASAFALMASAVLKLGGRRPLTYRRGDLPAVGDGPRSPRRKRRDLEL